MHKVLQYKTWGMNSFAILFRTLNFATGNTTWYELPKPPCLKLLGEIDAVEAYDSGACLLQNYNEDFVVGNHKTFRMIIIFFLILGLVLNVLIYKWRNLVDLCLLYDLMLATAYLSVPSSTIVYSVYSMLFYDIAVFAMSYTGRGSQIVQGTVFFLAKLYYTQLLVLNDKNFTSLYGYVSLLVIGILFFIYSSILAIVLNYTSNLHGVLRRYIEQSANLLDGMHEGMIILSKVTGKTLFCNRPA